jgi:hypothetical protein
MAAAHRPFAFLRPAEQQLPGTNPDNCLTVRFSATTAFSPSQRWIPVEFKRENPQTVRDANMQKNLLSLLSQVRPNKIAFTNYLFYPVFPCFADSRIEWGNHRVRVQISSE